MSHGRHSGRSIRASSTVSSASPVSSASSKTSVVTPDFSSIQKVIRHVFRSSGITVQQAERLQGRLHQIYTARLIDGSSLVLKCPPPRNTRTLRHEKYSLESERKSLETLHEYTQLPVPQMIKYDGQGAALGSPFLMMSHIPGRRLADITPYLSPTEQQNIDRTLGSCVRNLTALSATQFGMTHEVFARKGKSSWREAFIALLESVLRDAEDMLVTLPYDLLRIYPVRLGQFLDEVTEPRLVALHVCDPQNVLVDEYTKQVTGLVGFSTVIWGDPLMSGGIEGGSDAFFEGYGQCPARTEGTRAKQLMYTTFRETLKIVEKHFRPHLGIDETQARISMNAALHALAAL